MRSHDLLFFDTISWISLSKKMDLVFLIDSLKLFQSSINLKDWYTLILVLYSLFYHALEYLVILTFLEILY